MKAATERADTWQGTLSLMVLKTLPKLDQEGYSASEWGVADKNSKAKYYKPKSAFPPEELSLQIMTKMIAGTDRFATGIKQHDNTTVVILRVEKQP